MLDKMSQAVWLCVEEYIWTNADIEGVATVTEAPALYTIVQYKLSNKSCLFKA